MDRNKILKIIFIICTTFFLVSIVSLPKTDCEACQIEYNEKILNGAEAFRVFEDVCISYNTPWGNKINLSNISSWDE